MNATKIGKITVSTAILLSSWGMVAGGTSQAEAADSRALWNPYWGHPYEWAYDWSRPHTDQSDQAHDDGDQNAEKATIIRNVSFREGPTTSAGRIRYLQDGEQVEILQQVNEYWYKIKDNRGTTGYVSTSDTFIDTDYTVAENASTFTASDNALIEDVIAKGRSYWGTPYEFGSDRSSTRTFDCSDFVRRSFIEAAGLYLPTNSRTQADYVEDLGNLVYSMKELQRGDLVFFMSYEGSRASDYANVNVDKERVTHVGIYLGNGEMLHTYSKDSGGVRIDAIDGSWEHRFLYGGSVLQ